MINSTFFIPVLVPVNTGFLSVDIFIQLIWVLFMAPIMLFVTVVLLKCAGLCCREPTLQTRLHSQPRHERKAYRNLDL